MCMGHRGEDVDSALVRFILAVMGLTLGLLAAGLGLLAAGLWRCWP